MSEIVVKLELKKFSRFRKAMDPKALQAMLEKHVGRRSKEIGLRAEKLVRNRIKKSNVQPPNAALTIFIKGSSKPLSDRGELFQSITSESPSWDKVFVGVNQKDEHYAVAKAIHEGRIIPVTDKMRTMFFYLWLVSIGHMDAAKLTGRAAELWARAPKAGWQPLRDSTRAIKIPPRPFIEEAFKSEELRAIAERLWNSAVREALFELAEGRAYSSSYKKGREG